MKKFAVFSDLHIDTHNEETQKLIKEMLYDSYWEYDYIIIAGDIINTLTKNIEFVNDFFKEVASRVIFVPGNHELWLSNFHELRQSVDKLKFKHILLNESRNIDGVEIFGGTLWYPHSVEMDYKYGRWADFQYIKGGKQQIFDEYNIFIKNLRQSTPKIIVSHHAPSYRSVTQNWKSVGTNIFFANKLDELILEKSPTFWIHGHMHEPIEYTLGKTTVICNPFGYPQEFEKLYGPKVIFA